MEERHRWEWREGGRLVCRAVGTGEKEGGKRTGSIAGVEWLFWCAIVQAHR